jgi:transposase
MVVNKRRGVENGVRALLREAGLKVGTVSRKNVATRVGELVADDPVLATLTASLLSVIDVLTREADSLTKRVLDEVRVESTCRRLMTVQGVGPSGAEGQHAPKEFDWARGQYPSPGRGRVDQRPTMGGLD